MFHFFVQANMSESKSKTFPKVLTKHLPTKKTVYTNYLQKQ